MKRKMENRLSKRELPWKQKPVDSYTGIGAIIASFFVASCCIGPAIFVIFGTSLSFLGWFTIFEPYQGYFMAIAAVFLTVSFWKLYLRKTDCDCQEKGAGINSGSKIIFWIGLTLFLIAISFPKILLLIYD